MDSSDRCEFVCVGYNLWIHNPIYGLAGDFQNLYCRHTILLITGSGVLGGSTLLIFFFCPETAYERPAASNIDISGTIACPTPETVHKPHETEEPWTFGERLRPWRGIESNVSLLRLIINPILLAILPPVLFSFITGLSWSWFSVLLGVTADIYGSPPYNFTVFQIGLLFIGGVVVSIFAFISGPMNDWMCKFLARRNQGIYEPEVRFILIEIADNSSDLRRWSSVWFLAGWDFLVWGYP